MQPPTVAPRAGLTAAAVEALIQDAAALRVGKGCELLTSGSLEVVTELGGDFHGGSVSRNSYATLHGTAELGFATELDWGAAVVRPYLTLSDGTVDARFNLGAYFTSTPRRTLGARPVHYEVECYDVLQLLDDPIGDSYAVDTGASYLAAIEEVLAIRGASGYLIDQAAASAVLPSPMVWILADQPTWLRVVNDLLAGIGYAALWSDWDGRLRCTPYDPPRQRAPEWVYQPGAAAMLRPQRVIEHDFYLAPNRWVFWRNNDVDGPPPVEGEGMYSHTNADVGTTSVAARGGRVITRAEPMDVADHAALVAAAWQAIDADMTLSTTVEVQTSPMPLMWHFDRLACLDPELPFVDAMCTQWTLPLDNSPMRQRWTVL